jgi:hypothetical protein
LKDLSMQNSYCDHRNFDSVNQSLLTLVTTDEEAVCRSRTELNGSTAEKIPSSRMRLRQIIIDINQNLASHSQRVWKQTIWTNDLCTAKTPRVKTRIIFCRFAWRYVLVWENIIGILNLLLQTFDIRVLLALMMIWAYRSKAL